MTPAVANKSSLYTKLAEVAEAVTHVAKDGRNEHFRYDYVSAEAMLSAVRGPLAERNVVLMPSVVDIGEREIRTASGKVSALTTVRVQFTFVDGDSGESHACAWAGQGDDPGDKGLAKAYTSAVKTFLRQVFLLPAGDDPEADTQTDARSADRVATPPTPPGERVLTDAQRAKVIAALGLDAQRLLDEAGVSDLDHMTVADASALRDLLDAEQVKA